MDVLDLIARSEWPLVVGGALLIFRKPIYELLTRINITKIDAWGFKAEFEKELNKVDTLLPPKEETPSPKIAMGERITEPTKKVSVPRKEQSPEAVVLASWSILESDMRAMLDAIRPTQVGSLHVPPLRIQEIARRLGLSDDEIESLLTLRSLRNKVAHSAEAQISWEDAMRFKEATERLLAAMRKNWEVLRREKG